MIKKRVLSFEVGITNEYIHVCDGTLYMTDSFARALALKNLGHKATSNDGIFDDVFICISPK